MGAALGGQRVVLAGRTGVGLAPLVVDQPFAPELAEERIKGAFLGREIGRAQALEDVRDVHLVRVDDSEEQELEESFANRTEFLCQVHSGVSYLVIKR